MPLRMAGLLGGHLKGQSQGVQDLLQGGEGGVAFARLQIAQGVDGNPGKLRQGFLVHAQEEPPGSDHGWNISIH